MPFFFLLKLKIYCNHFKRGCAGNTRPKMKSSLLTTGVVAVGATLYIASPFVSSERLELPKTLNINKLNETSPYTEKKQEKDETQGQSVEASEKDIVKHIIVNGLSHIKEEDILKFIKHTKVNEEYSKDAVTKDLEEIIKSGAVQSAKARSIQSNGELYVVFDVTEISKIKSVKITGNTILKEEEILPQLITKPSQKFNKEDIEKDVAKIKELYTDKGYIAIVHDVNNNDGNVTFSVSEAKLADIKFEGNKKTKNWVMEKLTEDSLHKGDLLKVEDLQKAYLDLMSTGFFKDVKVDAEENTEDKNNVNLKIKVDEDKTGEWSLGGGYSDRYKMQFLGGLREKNLNGEAKSLSFNLGIGSGKNTFGLSYVDPYYKKTNTEVYLNIFRTNEEVKLSDANFDETHLGGTIGFSKPISKDKKTHLFSNIKIDRIDTDYIAGKKIEGIQDNTLTVGVMKDTRGRDEGQGTVLEATATLSSKLLGSDNNYAKLMAGVRSYSRLSARDVFASRLSFNYSPNELPTVAQFSIGGADSVRGLDEDAQRGNSSVLGTLELRHDFNNNLQGVIFVDAGKAWNDQVDNAIKVAAGIGVRVKTAMGILRLDAAKTGGNSIKYMFGIGQTF